MAEGRPPMIRLAAALLLLTLLSGGAGATEEPVVIVAAERIPVAYVENGKVTGLLVDLAEEAFRRAGRSVEFRLMPWPRCLVQVRAGEVDAIATLFRTPERETQYGFTQEPLLQQTEALFVKKGSTLRYKGDLSVLAGKKIGVVYQTSYGPRLDRALAGPLAGSVEVQRNTADLVKMLAHGRIELVPGDRSRVLSSAAALDLAGEIEELHPSVETVPGFLAFSRVRDSGSVGRSFDRALRAMKKDGTYAAILRKYPNY